MTNPGCVELVRDTTTEATLISEHECGECAEGGVTTPPIDPTLPPKEGISDCSCELVTEAHFAEDFDYVDTAALDLQIAADMAGPEGTLYWQGILFQYLIDTTVLFCEHNTLRVDWDGVGPGGVILGGYTDEFDTGPPMLPLGVVDSWSRVVLKFPETFPIDTENWFELLFVSYADDPAHWVAFRIKDGNLVLHQWKDPSVLPLDLNYTETFLANASTLLDGEWKEFTLWTVGEVTKAFWGTYCEDQSCETIEIEGAIGGIHFATTLDEQLSPATYLHVGKFEGIVDSEDVECPHANVVCE
jgi:hypothetical protein